MRTQRTAFPHLLIIYGAKVVNLVALENNTIPSNKTLFINWGEVYLYLTSNLE